MINYIKKAKKNRETHFLKILRENELNKLLWIFYKV